MEDLEVGAVGNHRNRQTLVGTSTDTFDDAGRKADTSVRRTIAEEFQERHPSEEEGITEPERSGEFRPKIAHLKDEWLSAQPFGGEARNDGRNRRRGRKDQVAVELERQADGA